MKPRKIIAAIVVAFVSMATCAESYVGMSDVVVLPNKKSSAIAIMYSPLQEDYVNVSVDGEFLMSATNSGTFMWQPQSLGNYVLVHTAGTYVWSVNVNVTNIDFVADVAPNPPGTKDTTLTLASLEKNFTTPKKGVGSFAVSSTVASRTWNASVSHDWISLVASSGIAGTDKVQYVVDVNTNAETRTGYVYVSGHVHTVTQAGCGATVEPAAITCVHSGGTNIVSITVDDDVAWRVKPESQWISVLPVSGVGASNVVVQVAPYYEVGTRHGTTTVGGQVISIDQRGRDMKLVSADTNLTYQAQSILIDVDALADVSWSVTPHADWLTVVHAGTGLGSSAVDISVAKNESYLARTGTITIGTETYTVQQGGCTALTFDLSASAVSVPAKRTVDLYVKVTATPDLPWTAKSECDWISLSDGMSSGAGNGSVAYSVAANPNLAERSGTILVTPDSVSKLAARRITITQAAAEASLDRADATITAAATNVEVQVSVDPVVKWSVSGVPDWVTLEVSGEHTGAGEVVMNVNENTTINPRECTITIAGHSFVLRQNGGVVGLERTGDVGAPEGGTVYLNVTGAENLNWSIVNVPNWVTIEGEATRKGSSTLVIRFAPNPSVEDRSCEITIGGQAWTFVQPAAVLEIAEDVFTHGAEADYGTIEVSAPSYLNWEVSTENSWITFFGGTEFSGTNEVMYIVDDIDMHDSRIGVITIGKSPVYVCQSGFTVKMDTRDIELSCLEANGTIPFVIGELDNENRWTAMTTVDWLALSKYSGVGDGTLRYTCEANTTGVARVGQIFMCDQVIEVKQYGGGELLQERSITYVNLKGATHANPSKYREGQKIVFTEPSEVTGYTFMGWTPDQITADTTGDIEVKANWEANSYVIKYSANGGTGIMASQNATYDQFITLSKNTFERFGYAFKGWADSADGEVGYVDGAIVSNLTAKASEVVTLYAVWELCELTPSDYLNADKLTFSFGGDLPWQGDVTVSHDGIAAMHSGVIGNKQSSEIMTMVNGAGIVSFWCKVSSEWDSDGGEVYDGFAVYVDGEDAIGSLIGGEVDWTNIIISVVGSGNHTIRWSYEKDKRDSEGDDCAWLDQVTWVPTDPIPDIGENPTKEQIAEALEGSEDKKLTECITNGAVYKAYREWAGKVKAKGGSTAVGAEVVKNAKNAWLSFALGSETLIETAPQEGDMKVDKFEPTTESGKFDFTVSVKDVEVGSEAAVENLKQVFGLEGGQKLGELSAENVDITFGTPQDGKVKFTAGPKDAQQTPFFMKVKMTP